MTKRVKYTETIIKTHYVDIECEFEDELNDFIQDNQQFTLGKNNNKPCIYGMKSKKYPNVNIKKVSTDKNFKSLGCTYNDEIVLRHN